MFPIIEVRSSLAEAVEYLDTKSKFWYPDGERQTLFKAEERGTGEDWAKKIASELCVLLGLPQVRDDMAADMDVSRPGATSARSSLLTGPARRPSVCSLAQYSSYSA
ncbi:MAG: hypothetical protein LC637_12735 [Xanthomonadaceae bacterium]|nr:hypothetical protein [Xanthomonadaceae bacterium]